MEELADKLSKFIFKNTFINLDDLKDISFVLDSYFHNKIYAGIEISDKYVYLMSYNFVSNKIKVVYNSLKAKIINLYDKGNYSHYLRSVTYFNLSIILLFFHEFRHSMQAYEIKMDSLLGALYHKSLDYINKKNKAYAIIYLEIYRREHEHFSTEVNANYTAYLWLIEILNILNFDDNGFFETQFMNAMKHEFNFQDYEFFHEDILGDMDIIENLRKALPIKEQILNGIYVPNPKNIKIRDLLLK